MKWIRAMVLSLALLLGVGSAATYTVARATPAHAVCQGGGTYNSVVLNKRITADAYNIYRWLYTKNGGCYWTFLVSANAYSGCYIGMYWKGSYCSWLVF